MTTELAAQQQNQIQKLSIPFHPAALDWRVTNKSRDGKKGAVIPYADQRAYTDRLNQIFTPAGWTRNYVVTTVSPIDRMKKDKVIHTGKVIVTCVIVIDGLGSHSGVGEMWADDDNAMTRAEAQAFKRACSCFGLGRYFYDFQVMWVDIDQYGQPVSLPTLPKWALPAGVVPIAKSGPQEVRKPAAPEAAAPAAAVTTTTTASQPTPMASGTLDPELTKTIEAMRPIVGDALYYEVFRKGGAAKSARELPHIEAQNWIYQQLSILDRGIQKVRQLAQEVHESAFFAVLDAHQVQSVEKIPSFEVLKEIVKGLQTAAYGAAA